MAIIKPVSSKAKIKTAINYVTKKEKTNEKLISGYNLDPHNAAVEMDLTKQIWGKEGGRTYKHYVQAFHKDDAVDAKLAHQIANEWVRACDQFAGFEVLIATHTDRDGVHTHFIVNSVSAVDGHKFQQEPKQLKEMRKLSDDICRKYGLHITEKGKTFHGEKRTETVAYKKDTYHLLKKAEAGTVKSYVQDIALACLECKEEAISKGDFIKLMNDKGYGVDWSETKKNITFTDLARQEAGEKQCKSRNSTLMKYYALDLSKEGLLDEFDRNAQRAEQQQHVIDAAEEQLNNYVPTEHDPGAEADDRGSETRNTGTEGSEQVSFGLIGEIAKAKRQGRAASDDQRAGANAYGFEVSNRGTETENPGAGRVDIAGEIELAERQGNVAAIDKIENRENNDTGIKFERTEQAVGSSADTDKPGGTIEQAIKRRERSAIGRKQRFDDAIGRIRAAIAYRIERIGKAIVDRIRPPRVDALNGPYNMFEAAPLDELEGAVINEEEIPAEELQAYQNKPFIQRKLQEPSL